VALVLQIDPARAADETKDAEPKEARTEFNVVPIFGGTSDQGYGGGGFFGLAKIEPGYKPYRWYLQGAAVATAFPRGSDKAGLAFQDIYAELTVPRLFDMPVFFVLRPSWTVEHSLGYYGVGNATTDTPPPGAQTNYFEYGRGHPAIDIDFRTTVYSKLAVITGLRYTQTWLDVFQGSKLEQDRNSPSEEVRHWVDAPDNHGVVTFRTGVQWDSRDSIVSAHRGMYHQATIELSPGGYGNFPERYGQTNLTLRGYVPLHPRVTFAARGIFDAQFGNVPFYELVRFDDTSAIGGVGGVRGVPAQRYGGKIKALGNTEVRVDIVHFRALNRPLIFGGAAFFDAGRVWADGSNRPDLDGTGIGLKWGVGLGPRIQSGEAFVIRADIAYSPDAHPVGGYFTGGQLF
jgi:hypothetical protein